MPFAREFLPAKQVHERLPANDPSVGEVQRGFVDPHTVGNLLAQRLAGYIDRRAGRGGAPAPA